MDYATFRSLRKPYERNADLASHELGQFPSGPLGLTPDAVKATPEFQAARKAWINADNALRDFDRRFTRQHRKTWPVFYKKEIIAERDARRASGAL